MKFLPERIGAAAMICFPNAKINIGLRVTEKRTDGYHSIETVMYPIGLKDALEVVPSSAGEAFSLTVYGMESVPLETDNLVVKAFRLIQQKTTLDPIDIHLYKAIPTGAGLGGGSSDAASMLKLLISFQGLDDETFHLPEMAAALGADCSFFLANEPSLATGIGDHLEPVGLSLKGYFLILVKPAVSVSTKAAYAEIHPIPRPERLEALIRKPVSEWKDFIFNDFEPVVFSHYPQIAAIKERLYAEGAVYASLTGSGSAVYGLFKQSVDISQAFPGCFYWSEKLIH